MTTKIIGGLAAAVLVVGVGIFAAGNGSLSDLMGDGSCSGGACSLSMPAKAQSCCSLSESEACTDEQIQAPIETEASEAAPVTKKACCSEKE